MDENSYKIFIENYNFNKDIIKDISFKVIKKFMNIFKDDIKDNIENCDYLLLEIQKFNEDNLIENIEKEYLNLIYISFITEKNNNKNSKRDFYIKLLSQTLNNYYLKRILLNFSIFKKTFKIIIRELFYNYDDLNNYIEVIKKEINKHNENYKSKILLFLFYNFLFTQSNNLSIEPNYIDINFEIPNILKLTLNMIIKDITLIMNSVQNSFNYIFNKHFFFLQKNNPIQYENLKNYFIEKLSTYDSTIYDNFIYILGDLLLKNDINNSPYLLLLTENILISNNKLLHQISINILNNFLDNSIIDNDFLKKYISVYDVLDGFNSHLFKSLYKELEFIIEFINNNNENEFKKKNYFSNPMNYFILLSKKILNNTNNRIQKFFVKTICKLNITNNIFIPYFLSDFLMIINNPLLYPENEINVYHLKMGLIIKQFYSNYFSNYPKFIFDLLNGISNLISNRKICFYLIQSIYYIIKNLNLIENEDNSFLISIEKIIDKYMSNNSSYYNKFIYWIFFCNLFLKTKFFPNKEYYNIYYRIYYELINYMINCNRDTLSIENLYFGSHKKNIKFDLFNQTVQKMNLDIKSSLKLDNLYLKNLFLQDNNLHNFPNEIQNYIYYSFLNSNLIEDYINNNILKIFSSYINQNSKKEILLNINCIMELNMIFKNYNNINNDLFNDVHSNLKLLLKSNTNNSFIEDFHLYETMLFNYISIFKYSFSDYLINEIELVNSSELIYFNLLFLKMYLFNLLSSIHYNVFTEKDLMKNKTLINNMNYIFNFLNLNFSFLNEINKNLLLNNLTLTMLLMNYLKINFELNIDINEIFSLFEVVNNKDIFYLIKYFQIFFDKKSNNIDLEIFKHFIGKTLNLLNEKKENFTYINVSTFLLTLLDKNKLQNEAYSQIIKENLNNFILLNDSRIWLLIKIALEILIEQIKDNNNLIEIYDDILIQFSRVRETRGQDSFMIQTSNLYLKSPFNIKVKNIMYNENLSKYGFYVRIGILEFYNELINNININNEGLIISILNTINKVILEINNLSSLRPEMELTDKHRKKLRLSQFLFTLSTIFKKENLDFSINENYNEIINQISNSFSLLIQKLNLYSVDYYIILSSILFLKHSQNFRNFLLNVLTNPESKSFIVTTCLIISSISLIEKYNVNENEIIEFINAIIIQCTSNIVNIRGYAQFFLFKINKIYNLITNNFLGQSFLEYLNRNKDILTFFNKFDLIYTQFIFLLDNFSIDNLIKNTFNEISNEIIPIDIYSNFKNLSFDSILLDNQDYSKVSSSWRFVFDTKEEIKKITEKKIKDDFQKKYRPLQKDIYHNIQKKKFDIIIIGSYIDNLPNLGGLVRTSEIFNINKLIINDEKIINDKSFLTAASSGEKWINLINVNINNMRNFIIKCKKMGYFIFGIEECNNSIEVKNIKFKEKIVFVVGNEKDGIGKDIIDLIDTFIFCDKFGEGRSLNIHINAGLVIWECINCLIKNNVRDDI